uniref:Centrosomin N-terminal motif 1 domain-containing protein n=1 Tax=Calidris pygmaea TaxID=425635 RepID=A0A8C3PK21_9CHAR
YVCHPWGACRVPGTPVGATCAHAGLRRCRGRLRPRYQPATVWPGCSWDAAGMPATAGTAAGAADRLGPPAVSPAAPCEGCRDAPPMERLPAMANGYRTLSQHLNDLKKENFSLKLRIYFLEERVQQKGEDSRDDVYRRNIELKVEVESLKRELQEKQQALDNTW